MKRPAPSRTALPPARAATIALALTACAGNSFTPAPASAQTIARNQPGDTPIYLDDAPAATETLRRVPELVASGAATDAARELQRLLEEDPGRLLTEPNELGTYPPVRREIHRVIADTPELLVSYRLEFTPSATALLKEQRYLDVERAYFLTRPGFAATLATAGRLFEDGQFHAATLRLQDLLEHPDASDQATADRGFAAGALNLVEQLVPFGHASHLLEPWAERAAREANPRDPFPLPAFPDQTDALSPTANRIGESFGDTPMWSAWIDPSTPADATSALEGFQEGWSFPAIVDDLVIVNTGSAVHAWDRYTLDHTWSFVAETASQRGTRRAPSPNDAFPVVATPLGVLAEIDPGTAARRIVLIDPATGEPRWQTPIGALTEGRSEASVSGPPLVDGYVVILSLEVTERLRRLKSSRIVAIDLVTGDPLWERPVASAGATRSRSDRTIVHAPAARDGIGYFCDPRGVVSAIELTTGRFRWVRTLGDVDRLNPALRSAPWAQPSVVVEPDDEGRDRVVLLTPDRSTIHSFDAKTGAKLDTLRIKDATPPAYILSHADTLYLVERDRISTLPLTGFSTETPESLFEYDGAAAFGRGQILGDTLALPVAEGLTLIDLETREPAKRSLAVAGNTVVAEGQAVVLAGGRLFAYLAWPAAERELVKRIAEDPNDATLIITFAQLAFRAGALDQVTGAIDQARSAIDAAPDATPSPTRDRLFAAVRDMIETAPDDASLDAGEPNQNQSQAFRFDLLARLDQIARTPTQLVAANLLGSQLESAAGRPTRAVDRLQTILTDADLAAASYRSGRVRVRARVAATDRLREIVRTEGPSIYTAYATAAQEQLAQLDASTDPSTASSADYEALALAYPAAPAALYAWLRASERSDNPTAALEAGLAAVWSFVGPAGNQAAPDAAAEIVGRSIEAMDERDRLFAAAQTLARLKTAAPDLIPAVRGVPFDAAERLAEYRALLATVARKPRVGLSVDAVAQALDGWKVLTPLAPDPRGGPPSHVVLRSRVAGLVALFTPETADDGSPGELRASWSRPLEGRDPRLLTLTSDAATFVRSTDKGVTLELVDALTGETRWQTDPLYETIGHPSPEAMKDVYDTPLDGSVRATDILLLLGENAIVTAERTGRLAAYDRRTGEVLWTKTEGLPTIQAVDLEAGILAVAGFPNTPSPAEDLGEDDAVDAAALFLTGRPAQVVTLDARTGDELARLEAPDTDARWVRVTPDRKLLLATGQGLAAYAAQTAAPIWSNDDPALRLTADAWLAHNAQGVPDRVLVLGPDRQLWSVNLAGGTLGDVPLADAGRLRSASRTRVARTDDATAFLTNDGVVVFGPKDQAIGRDALPETLLTPAVAQGLYATVARNDFGQSEIALLDQRSGRLLASTPVELRTEPDQITLLDERILVSAGAVTLVYATSPADQPSDQPNDEQALDADTLDNK